MADTSIFEVTRQTHEEIERYTQAAVELLAGSTSTGSKDSLRRQHQTSAILDRIVSRYSTLHNLYSDTTDDSKRESETLATSAGPGGMDEFYARLGKVRDYHKKYPNATPDVFTVDLSRLNEVGPTAGVDPETGVDAIDRMFSGEEMGGRFLDLYMHHDAFLNLKGVRRVTYLAYLDSFHQLRGESSRVSDEAKRTEAYRKYLQGLQAYLLDFLRKTRPLTDVDALELTALATFEEDWTNGRVPGWEDQGDSVLGHGPKKTVASDALPAEGIWCDACKRSFAKQTVFDAHLKGTKHIKAVQRLTTNGSEQSNGSGPSGHSSELSEVERMKRQARAKAIARDESVIIALANELQDVRTETRANVERKAALTERERQAEAEAAAREPAGGREAEEAGADDDDDEERIYNPLKLPLGWDGKPIPYWLYKLHGLGVEFKCEICSDFVYQGRKNFERHFSESRHAFGMRALGLPNTKHFYEITRIEDALALAEKLKRQGKTAAEEQGDAEEVEDEHGNTYTRKTYELLKRQGLI